MDRSSDRNREQSLNDLVVQRLFAAGLDLQAALALVSDPVVTDKIDRASGQLDRAILDLRDTIFDRDPPGGGPQLMPSPRDAPGSLSRSPDRASA
jgi:hypothetical protein